MRKKLAILFQLALCFALFGVVAVSVLMPDLVLAQGKNAQDWPTANATPQRDAWIREDFQISPENMQSMTGFGVVRKYQLEGSNVDVPLGAFHTLASLRGSFGFHSGGFITDGAGNLWALDSDMPLVLWKTNIAPPTINPSAPCTVASAGAADVTALSPGSGGGGGGGGRGRGASNAPPDFPGRGVAGGRVGEPDQGAPSLQYFTGLPDPNNPGRGGGGRGQAQPPANAVREELPYDIPIPFPEVYVSNSAPADGRGGAPGIFVVTADGKLRSLSKTLGFDVYMAPTDFLPPNSQPLGLIALNKEEAIPGAAAPAPPDQGGFGGGGRGGFSGTPLLYVATSSACGGQAGVWAIDLDTPNNAVTSWTTGDVAGKVGPAIGTDGTVYVATGSGEDSSANSLVALAPGTLQVKSSFSPGDTPFVSSPVVMSYDGRDLVAAVNQDGKMYLLDSQSMGGPGSWAPLASSVKFANFGSELPGALATWEDENAEQWILTSVAGPLASTTGFQTNGNVSSGAIVAFKIGDQGGQLTLEPGWVSPNIASPLPPIIVNGVVFTAGVGPQGNAVLYALDGATGRPFTNTGDAVSGKPTGLLSEQFGTVYLRTTDNVLWALGFSQQYMKEDHGELFNE